MIDLDKMNGQHMGVQMSIEIDGTTPERLRWDVLLGLISFSFKDNVAENDRLDSAESWCQQDGWTSPKFLEEVGSHGESKNGMVAIDSYECQDSNPRFWRSRWRRRCTVTAFSDTVSESRKIAIEKGG